MAVRVGDQAPDLPIPDFETLEPVALSSAWADGPAVILFQRYYGCPFCQLQVATVLEDLDRFNHAGATVTLVGHGERDAIKLGKAFSPFTILFDHDRLAYAAYGLARGTALQSYGPRQWIPMAKANAKPDVRQGGFMGGDVLQLPGTFVVDQAGILLMAYRSSTASDIPSNDSILRVLAAD